MLIEKNFNIKTKTLLICLLLSFMFGCGTANDINPTKQISATSTSTTVVESSPKENDKYVFITSEPETVTLHGELIVLDPKGFIPNSNGAIFLVTLAGSDNSLATIPPFVVGEVPMADVDVTTGEFVFHSIQPGQYAVVILTSEEMQIPSRRYNDGSYVIFTIDESDKGNVIELGYITLP